VIVFLTSSTFREAKSLIPAAGSVLEEVRDSLSNFNNITGEMQSIVSGLSNINLVAGYFAGRLQDFTELFEFTDALKVCIHAAGVCPNI